MQLFTNAARTTLAASITNTDTSLTVANGSLFPVANLGATTPGYNTNDWFKIVLQKSETVYEIAYVRTHTSGSTTLSDIMRGQEGTTALAFSAGDVVGIRVTALEAQNAANAQVDGPAGTVRPFTIRTNGVLRWWFGALATAESGGNAGSDFVLNRCDDSGALVGLSPFRVNRADGMVQLGGNATYNTLRVSLATLITTVNALQVDGAATGGDPTMSAQGSDTNINLRLTSKGTGKVRLHSATQFAGLDVTPAAATGGDLALAPSTAGVQARVEAGAYTPAVAPVFSATPTFDCSASNWFEPGPLTGNVTSITLTNPKAGQTITIAFVQDATGGRTVAAPSGASINGSMPTAANAIGLLTLTYYGRGSKWIGGWSLVA